VSEVPRAVEAGKEELQLVGLVEHGNKVLRRFSSEIVQETGIRCKPCLAYYYATE